MSQIHPGVENAEMEGGKRETKLNAKAFAQEIEKLQWERKNHFEQNEKAQTTYEMVYD